MLGEKPMRTGSGELQQDRQGQRLPRQPSSQEHRSPVEQGTRFQGATGSQEAPGTEATPLILQT